MESFRNFVEKNCMRKALFIGFCLALLFSTCHKAKNTLTEVHESTAVLLDSDAKGSNYSIILAVGHSISDCKGRCVYVGGRYYHYDCMSYGNACATSSVVSLTQVGANNYTATTVDSTALTGERFFDMPARSLFVEYDANNKEVWLNIPAQLVYRDSVSKQFTFTGLFYTDIQYYANN